MCEGPEARELVVSGYHRCFTLVGTLVWMGPRPQGLGEVRLQKARHAIAKGFVHFERWGEAKEGFWL